MCGIVDGESKLVPEARKWYGTGNIPSGCEQVDECAEEQAITQTLDAIRGVVAIIESLCFDPLL
jgi:hypothetical protein